MDKFLTGRMIKKICERPAMFVINGSFSSVATFLDGFDTGVAQFANEGEDLSGLHGFRRWLAAKFYQSHDMPRNLGWDAYIMDLYPDDKTRFQQLEILFDEFLRDGAKEKNAIEEV